MDGWWRWAAEAEVGCTGAGAAGCGCAVGMEVGRPRGDRDEGPVAGRLGEAAAGRGGGVFGPELEAALDSERGE